MSFENVWKFILAGLFQYANIFKMFYDFYDRQEQLQ